MPDTGAGAFEVVWRFPAAGRFVRIGSIRESLKALAIACLGVAFACSPAANAQPAPGPALNPLTASILAEDLDGVRAALDAGESANAADPHLQRSPLHIAVSPGSPRAPVIVELLVSRGADLNAEDATTGLTSLMVATIVAEIGGPFAVLEFQKSKILAERLLNLGADPARATPGGETPLLVAVSAGNIEVLRLLIARGAKPDQAGAKGETPLARATKLKRTEMVRALVEAGAATPPQVAARGGYTVPEAPEPEAAPAPEGAAAASSGISGWLIGGLAVAAGVVAAAVMANNAKKQRQSASNAAQANTQQAPAPPAPPIQPQPQPQPQPVPCLPGYALMNGACQPIPTTMPPIRPTVQVFDGEYNSTRVLADGFTHAERITVSGLNMTARHTFTNGSASGSFDWTGTITQTAADRGTISGRGTITNLGTRAFMLLPGSSIGRNAAGIMSINWTGTDPRFGGIGWTSDRVPAAAPPPQCVPPQALQNGVCVTPAPVPTPPVSTSVPTITNVTPANMAALFRLALNGGSDAVTVNWSSIGPVAVSDVAIAYTWTCASGARTYSVHATPAAGASSAVLRWFANDTGIGCPEFSGAGPGNAPTSAVINLTYKANGTGPNLVVSRPYGQIACLTFYPDEAAFPVNVTVKETWSNNGGSFSFNRQLPHPYGYASYSGLADATLDNAFRVCNGRFISASAVRTRSPSAADPQAYRNAVQAANGMLTFTEQVTRPGAPVSENAVFTYRYSIATGEYSFVAAGGQRNAGGGVSALGASRSGKANVRVEVSSPQDPGYVPTPSMADTPQAFPLCAPPAMLDAASCVSTVAIPNPPGMCMPPLVIQNGVCGSGSVLLPPVVLPPVPPGVVPAGSRVDSTPRKISYVSGGIRPQYSLWQMNSKILSIGIPKWSPTIWGVVSISGIGTTLLVATVSASGYPPGSQYHAGLLTTDLAVDVTLEVPAAGSPTVPNNYMESVTLLNQKVTTGSTAAQVYTQKLKSKIVRILDVDHSPPLGGTVSYSGIGTDTLVITVRAGGYPGTALVDFSAKIMY